VTILICHHHLLKTSFSLSTTTNAPTHLLFFAMAFDFSLSSSWGLILSLAAPIISENQQYC